MDVIEKLYRCCLAPKPTTEWLGKFGTLLGSGKSAHAVGLLLDQVAVMIASRFLDAQDDFMTTDRAINNLAGYAIATNNIPKLFWAIYLAYDCAEMGNQGNLLVGEGAKLPERLQNILRDSDDLNSPVRLAQPQTKNSALQVVLQALNATLGNRAFVELNHWPDDPNAIGLAPADRPGVLAYISLLPSVPGNYFVSFESPPAGAWLAHSYTPHDGRIVDSAAQVCLLVQQHFMRKFS